MDIIKLLEAGNNMIIDKPICGIYKITNIQNNKCYIGQSANIKFRWITHIIDSINNDQAPLHIEMQNIGIQNFKLEILEECSIEQLNDKEQYYIKYYNSLIPNGYNKNEGGKYTRNSFKNLKNNIKINYEDLKFLKPPLKITYNEQNNEYIISSIKVKHIVNDMV